MVHVVIHFNSTLHHFSQVLAGFQYLHDRKQVLLKYILEPGRYPGDIFRIDVNGLKMFFDLADNSQVKWPLYKECDFYVKRMLLKQDFQKFPKLIPYGLYYPLYYKNNYLKYLFLKDFSYLRYSVKYWNTAATLLNLKDGISVNELARVESPAVDGDQIIFRSQLWNPENNPDEWKKEERKVLNQQRMEINRKLKFHFGSKFTGGIRRNDYSERVCPDLVLPKKEYHRKKYLNNLKTASIGVVNQGLEGSIGAKLGEYVANGMAILTTPITQFAIPGFVEGENYLVYQSSDECLELTKELVDKPHLRRKMQEINIGYYREFLHPGKKIQYILDRIDQKTGL